MTQSSTTQSCPYSPHLGPVGCLPAPNIFHLANELAKGKMFWNTRDSHCLAGEPKHFPFAIVLIIKITLTCTRGLP